MVHCWLAFFCLKEKIEESVAEVFVVVVVCFSVFSERK